MKKSKSAMKILITRLLIPVYVLGLFVGVMPTAKAETVKEYGDNLVYNNGTMDGILYIGESERTLNSNWGASYPVATYGGPTGDSPAKVKDIDGNAVIALEPSSGSFASFFADLYAEGEKLPAGTYRLSVDILPVGESFSTDNVGFNLYNQYSNVLIYENGWKNCVQLGDGWLHYEQDFQIYANSVDSIQFWFNTMGTSTLYVDNLSICEVLAQEESAPVLPPVGQPDAQKNLVANNGSMDSILSDSEAERILNGDWGVSYPVATFGGVGGDSPAKVKNIDGNAVIALEPSTGNFASFFADLYEAGEKLPAGSYQLSMDILPVGESFVTDNVGFNLYNQYTNVLIYENGWKNCTADANGWLHYEAQFDIDADCVDSIQFWFNTMGTSKLYVDNLNIFEITEEDPEKPDEPQTPAPQPGDNLVIYDGSMDHILGESETERTLNGDWTQSYPVATFGGAGGDSPAKVKKIDGNSVIALEYSTGTFASFFADLYEAGEKLPAGTYQLSLDMLPVGEGFSTDNVGFNLYDQYANVLIYEDGWKNCSADASGWMHYEVRFDIAADRVDSIQFWFNTMGSSVLYVDNLCIREVTEEEPTDPDTPTLNPSDNLVIFDGSMDHILGEGETERTLNNDWTQSYPVATFGGAGGDSPAKIKNVDGNNVIALERSTGNFASFFLDVYAQGEKLPAGYYELSMDLKPVGTGFRTDNMGFNLYGQFKDIRIYDQGWRHCTRSEDGWYHYSRVFVVSGGEVDSLQMWFNTMGLSPEKCALYIDNISLKPVDEPGDNPVTGDHTPLVLLGMVCLSSLTGLIMVFHKKKAFCRSEKRM